MSRRGQPLDRIAAVLLACFVGFGCAGFGLPSIQRYEYFAPPAPGDPWSPKISGWQRRERSGQRDLPGGLPDVADAGSHAADPATHSTSVPTRGSGAGVETQPAATELAAESLRGEYSSFLSQRRRASVREFAEWVQAQAKRHYIADGPIDHWATLEETLRSDGDDCDGLELLAFHGLRELGVDASKVLRSIVYRPSDGQHHMVTLWFEDPTDPWVIDPTGAMTTGMPRMSQLPEWVPIKTFTESLEFSVKREARDPRSRTLAKQP